MNRTLVVALSTIALFAGAAVGGLTKAPQTPDKPAAEPLVGATLLQGLGQYRFPVTSSHPLVQRWFDQGLMLTFGFNHDAAERSFLKATELDPDCAMCWWGAPLVLGPHVNSGMDPARNRDAWARLQRAISLAPRSRLSQMLTVKILSGPDNRTSAPGSTIFEINGVDAVNAVKVLAEKSLHVDEHQRDGHNAIRISTHFYNTMEEIDRTVEALKKL